MKEIGNMSDIFSPRVPAPNPNRFSINYTRLYPIISNYFNGCNRALHTLDNSDLFEAAVDYLNKNKTS
jgi:hypothetical protein